MLPLHPTHLLFPQAAVATAPLPTQPTRAKLEVVWARNSLPLPDGSRALALGMHPTRGVEVLIQCKGGGRRWQGPHLLGQADVARWITRGF